MKHPSHRMKKILLLLVSAVVWLLVAEGVLRRVSPSQVVGVGTDRAPNARYYGWALPPDEALPFFHPDTGRLVAEDRTNSRGWKDVEHSLAKPPGSFRIVIVGDSNTFGCVPLADLYTRQVERLLHARGATHVEVISLGVGAWGTDQALEALRREGLLYQPDLAIYQFCGNDVTDNLQPRSDRNPDSIFQKKPFKYRVTAEGLVREERQVRAEPVSPSLRLKKMLLRSALVWNLNRALRSRSTSEAELRATVAAQGQGEADPATQPVQPGTAGGGTAVTPTPRKADPTSPYFPYVEGPMNPELAGAWELLERLVAEMQAVCESGGARLLVFSEESEPGKRAWYLRSGYFETDAAGDFVMAEGRRYPVNWTRPLRNLSDLCARRGIPLIAPGRTYERYINDSHPTAAGNLAMAMDIVDVLIAQGMVPGVSTAGPTTTPGAASPPGLPSADRPHGME